MSILLNCNVLNIPVELAAKIGTNESIILQQIHYWTEKKTHYKDGEYWVYNSVKSWHQQFPFMAERTIQGMLSKLEKDKLLISANYNKRKYDRTKWYRIDYKSLEKLNIEIPTLCKKCNVNVTYSAEPIPKTNTQNNINTSLLTNDGVFLIEYFLEQYSAKTGITHRNISDNTLYQVNAAIEEYDITTDKIDEYFRYNLDCDYHIEHFISDGIQTVLKERLK